MLVDSGPLLILGNAIALSLAISFILLLLWYDASRAVHQSLAFFLIAVVIWNIGSLFTQMAQFTVLFSSFTAVVIWLSQFGFAASSVSAYLLVATLIGLRSRWFRLLTLTSLIVTGGLLAFVSAPQGEGVGRPSLVSGLVFLLFGIATVYIVWQSRRKIDNRVFVGGITLFVLGQSIGFLNPELGITASSATFSSIGALIASIALLNAQVIQPLRNAGAQLETLHEVSVAITSRIAIDAVLKEIAERAVAWLRADASGIYLFSSPRTLELRTIHNLPTQYVGIRIEVGSSPAGIAALQKQSLLLENYPRDWSGGEELPEARETFGSMICTPLLSGDEVTGVLSVISSRTGRLFTRDDVRLLELLCAQASVALEHSHLFNEQQLLAQRLAVANDQLRAVLTSTENPVMALDRNLRFLFFNPAAERLLDAKLQVGEFILNHVAPTVLPTNLRNLVQTVHNGKEYVYEVTLRAHTYYCHIAALGMRRIQGWVVVLNDITQLKELDRMKSEMVRMTSHDLKNPLQAALANLDLLREDLAEDKSEAHLSLGKIEHQLNRMSRIIGGILDLERVRMGVNPNEFCSPERIALNAIDELGESIRSKSISLQVSIESDLPKIWGDSQELERALVNLIENAIKFTDAGGQVAVSVSCEERSIVFTVSDTGIGIPKEQHEQVYDRFFRGRQPGAEHISGSGLGLSLVKAIVESHQGTISLQSAVGQGTTFRVCLPLERVQN